MRKVKKFFCIILMIMVSICNFSTPSVYAEDNNGTETIVENQNNNSQNNIEITIQTVDLGDSYTTAPLSKSRMASSTATTVSLRSGNYVNWIDRIEVPQYGQEFYNQLVEACDNDGTDDWLIDVTDGSSNINNGYGILVTTFSGQADNKDEMDTEISNYFTSYQSVIRAVYDAFDRDHPEVFWLSGSTIVVNSTSYNPVTFSYNLSCYFILQNDNFDIRATGYTDVSTIKTDIAIRDNAVASILNEMTGTKTYEKVKYLNSWLTSKNDYNSLVANGETGPDSAHECLCALTGTSGEVGPVCEGYARAFKVLCDQANIPCVLVDGTANNGLASEAHMWNYVQVDGIWYAIDVTWNDPITNGDTTGNENYFLVGSHTLIGNSAFINSHPVSNTVSVNGLSFINGPELNENKYENHEHSYTTTTVSSTCTEKGYTAYTCTICGYTYNDDYIDALKHSWDEGNVTKEATCTEAGIKTYTCLNDASHIKTEEFAVLGHNYITTVVSPTNTTQGYTLHECTRCGDSYKDNYIEKIIDVTDVALNKTSATIYKGKTLSLTATLSPSNATNQNIIWSSSDESIATVANGKVTAIKAGTATITAKTSNGKKATCKITVPYTITYKLNGGTNSSANPASYYGKTITLSNPTRTGYTFGGWYTDSSYKTKVTSFSNGDKTLYAKWTATKYTIKYNLNGGTNNTSNPSSYNIATATITLKNPTKKGYTFGGWYSDSKYKTKVTKIAKGSTGNKTLYAKWTATRYTIKYNLNGGTNSTSNPSSYNIATATVTLKNPTKKGYTFSGWYSDSKYKTKVTKIAKGSTGNKTLYAKWTKVSVAKAKTPALMNVSGRKLKISYSATSGAKGYQIQYSTSSKFTSVKSITTTAKSYTTGALTKNKTYYVRVRAYKLDSKGNKVYGSWSAVKNQKVTDTVYVSKTGKKYHLNPACSNMKNPSQVSLSEAKKEGLNPVQNVINLRKHDNLIL